MHKSQDQKNKHNLFLAVAFIKAMMNREIKN